jgi:acyl-CoA synthetase (AMP-forming)/AMP-acid ligase II
MIGPTAPWGADIREEVLDEIPMRVFHPRPQHLIEIFADGSSWNTRPHLIREDLTLTFADLDRHARNGAVRLAAAGLRPGMRALLLGHGSPEWIVAFWSIVAAGGVVTLGNAWWSQDELDHAVDVASPAVILADDATCARVSLAPGVFPFSTLLDERSAGTGDAPTFVAATRESDPAIVLFTSGTTGKSKGAVLSHRAVIAGMHSALCVTKRLPYDPTLVRPQVTLSTGPLFHISGLHMLLQALLFGRAVVFPRGRFDAEETLDLIEEHRVDRWAAVTTMMQRVLDHPTLADHDVSSMRSLSVGGSAVPTELLQRMGRAFPNAARHITQAYGLTETGGLLTATSALDAIRAQPGMVGRPMPLVDLRIDSSDDTGAGEIVAKCATQMTGYLNENAEDVIDADGWLHTGDLGRLDEDGYLHLVGRSKDLIIRGGENIAAAHVEQVLMSFPGVLEVAVVPLPHADLGEEVAAAMVASGDLVANLEQLITHAKTRLAKFERPSRWLISNGPLPVNSVGKVDKRRLIDDWPVGAETVVVIEGTPR